MIRVKLVHKAAHKNHPTRQVLSRHDHDHIASIIAASSRQHQFTSSSSPSISNTKLLRPTNQRSISRRIDNNLLQTNFPTTIHSPYQHYPIPPPQLLNVSSLFARAFASFFLMISDPKIRSISCFSSTASQIVSTEGIPNATSL